MPPQGGRGGLGNAALASRARKAPGFALLGEKGQDRDLTLELKTVADVGLIGFPSAGKSSLVSTISAAKPKIADYPFTTLAPNLGVVSAGEHTFTVADVPGLIPGASEGRGLGLDFLRHIERCAVLVHVVDCATLEPGRDPISDIDALEAELAAYTPDAAGRFDARRPRRPAARGGAQQDRRARGPRTRRLRPRGDRATLRLAGVRGVDGEPGRLAAVDIRAVGHGVGLSGRAARGRAAPPGDPADPGRRERIHRRARRANAGGFIVRGVRPERWVAQTDFANDEAVGYLGDRLARLGVEDELLKLGAEPGCAVTIGDMTFDWEPQTPAGVDVTPSGRGTDARLEQNRPGRRRRTQSGARKRRREHGDEP